MKHLYGSAIFHEVGKDFFTFCHHSSDAPQDVLDHIYSRMDLVIQNNLPTLRYPYSYSHPCPCNGDRTHTTFHQ